MVALDRMHEAGASERIGLRSLLRRGVGKANRPSRALGGRTPTDERGVLAEALQMGSPRLGVWGATAYLSEPVRPIRQSSAAALARRHVVSDRSDTAPGLAAADEAPA